MTRKVLTVAIVALLALAVVAGAQMPPRQGGQGPGPGPNGAGMQQQQQGPPPGPQQGPPPDAVLKDVLGFTDAQLADFHVLMQARGQAIEALQPQIAEAEKALAEALHATTPDPCVIGAKLLAVDALHKQVAQADETFKAGFTNLLTADQKSKVAEIFSLQASLQAGELLRRLGL